MLNSHDPLYSTSLPSLNPKDFERFSRLLMDRFGLEFSGNRHTELEIAVVQSFAASTFTDIQEYYRFLLEEMDGGAELERLVNVATINETHFFRDSAQCDVLLNYVLPELIRKRRSIRTLRIWSAGCASGEEPYSVAIMLRELLPDIDEWTITILGTDINTGALARARHALYSEWSFREDQAKALRDVYFIRQGNRWELIPDVRRMVMFSRLNLASTIYPSYETNTNYLDLILCRNVLIYLSEATTKTVVDRFYNALQGGGWLAVSPSETSFPVFQRYKVHNFPSTTFHQRMSQSAALSLERARGRTPGAKITGRLSLRSTGSLNLRSAGPQPLRDPPPAPSTSSTAITDNLLSKAIEQAQDLIDFGHSEEARDVLLKLSVTGADQGKVCTMLGQVYANLGDWLQAEQWCLQAIRLTKLSIDAYYVLALVLQHRGDLAQAIEMMKKVIYLDRGDVLGHFGLANLYHENSQVAKALKSLDNALHLLEPRTSDDLVPRSSGVTVRRLREAIILQEQRWNGEVAMP